MSHPNALGKHVPTLDCLRGGFGSENGEEWKEQRRLTLYVFKNTLLRQRKWETMIQEVAREYVNELKEKNGKPVICEQLVYKSLIINMMSLLFGRHVDAKAEKEDIEMICRVSKETKKFFSSTYLKISLPWQLKIFKILNFKGYGDFLDHTKEFEAIFKREVQKRIRSKGETVEDDFIGYYLSEMEKRKKDINTSYSEKSLIGNLFTLMLGGLTSTVNTLCRLFSQVAKHQDIQKKICEEIDREIGRDGTVYHDDRIRLPYTLASILEMLRWVSVSGLFPPRYVTESFTFRNYEIPQGAHILCNAYAMMHDPQYFEDPMVYKPERFLATDGSVRLYNVDAYGPFSFGRRNCPGDGIAVMTAYLYFVTIMQKFSVQPPPGKEPDMNYVFSGAILPTPQELCFIER